MILTFPIASRRLPDVERQAPSYDTMMVYRLGLGRPWLDMLSHEDQARVAGDFERMREGAK